MSYEKFLRDKLIKRQNPDFKQIEYQLKRESTKAFPRIVVF